MKVLIQAPLSPYFGYGNDGIGMTEAFQAIGADVYLEPAEVQSPLPVGVLEALSKDPKGPFDLSIIHLSPGALISNPGRKKAAKVLIGWTMWEWTTFEGHEAEHRLRDDLKHLDALVVYDEISKMAFEEHYDGPIITLQGGFDPSQWPPVERDFQEEVFRFIQIGVLTERKAPFDSVQAFKIARDKDEDFRKNARLSMKTTVPGLHSKMQDLFMETDEHGNKYPTLRIFYDTWPVETVKKFYESGHVLLAPSRGEGKNLPALEFLSTGAPVIASYWGGHKAWLSDEYAYGIDTHAVVADPEFRTAKWGQVDVEQMAELMLHTFHNRAEVERKGQIAAEVIPKMKSWETTFRQLIRTLSREVPEANGLDMIANIAETVKGRENDE